MVIKKYAISALTVLMLFSSATSALGASLLQQSNFEDGKSLPWHISESEEKNASGKVVDGAYCITMYYPGKELWDVAISHREISLVKDHRYTASFKVKAEKDCKIRAKIGDQREPYGEESFIEVSLKGGADYVTVFMPQAYDSSMKDSFKSKQDHPLAEFAIHMGGNYAASGIRGNSPNNIYFDDFELTEPSFEPTPTPTLRPISDIRLNQLGYLPNAIKKATVKTSSTNPLSWELKNSEGKAIADGLTTPFGFDNDSGDTVHIIDFSGCKTLGKGYTLWVDGANKESNPFDISEEIYSQMQKDALKFFYHNRSGIDIQMPYAEKPEWARAAGHTKDVISFDDRYTINGTGGWYDGGIYTKSVLEGGNALWKLMNQYERAKVLGKNTFGIKDGQMNIPESSNKIPDILDEAKWEMDFLVNMQVPSGTMKGMVHHKLVDWRWVPLAVLPENDNEKRVLKDTTTNATLNLAALGAQAYRAFAEYDPNLAGKYLAAAQSAWDAAVAHPDRYYPTVSMMAGCGYVNDNYGDEDFYWAACELYAATGDEKYYNYLKKSKHYLGVDDISFIEGSYTENSSNLGTISLLLSEDKITKDEKAKAIENLSNASNQWLDNISKQGYGVPILGDQSSGFPMYSNSLIVDIAMNLAYAYDFTKDVKYLNGCTEIMDYILGRNPLEQSYVTGYGEGAAKNPNHNFFAYQADNSFPKPPPGFLVSGPNSGCQDPWIEAAGLKGKPAEKCYIDNIESWSSNCLYNNMNASLAWLTAYLSEGAKEKPTTPTPSEKVVYGDYNGDSTFDPGDFISLRRFLLDIISKPKDDAWEKRMDVNGDKVIDSADYSFLHCRLLEKIKKFPVED